MPSGPRTVCFTVYFPDDMKNLSGFFILLSTMPSLLKSHSYELTGPVDWSVNRTARGVYPETGDAVNCAEIVGVGVLTVM